MPKLQTLTVLLLSTLFAITLRQTLHFFSSTSEKQHLKSVIRQHYSHSHPPFPPPASVEPQGLFHSLTDVVTDTTKSLSWKPRYTICFGPWWELDVEVPGFERSGLDVVYYKGMVCVSGIYQFICVFEQLYYKALNAQPPPSPQNFHQSHSKSVLMRLVGSRVIVVTAKL